MLLLILRHCSSMFLGLERLRENAAKLRDLNPVLHKYNSSSLARQPLVGPGLLKNLCPFVSVEGDFPVLDT